MPTIAAGAAGSYTFTGPQTVTITCDPAEVALWEVSRSGRVIASSRATNDQVIGPFQNADVMTITAARGAIDYTVNSYDSPYRLTDAQVQNYGIGKMLMNDGSVATLVEATPYVTRTSTGTAFSGACELAGYDCTVAAGTITIYDNTAASGTVIVPATTLTLGRTEFAYKRALTTGCHVVLSGAATVNVLVG